MYGNSNFQMRQRVPSRCSSCHMRQDQRWRLNTHLHDPEAPHYPNLSMVRSRSSASSPAPPVDTVDALQVGHGLANLQRVQDESEHLQGVLVSLQVVAQL